MTRPHPPVHDPRFPARSSLQKLTLGLGLFLALPFSSNNNFSPLSTPADTALVQSKDPLQEAKANVINLVEWRFHPDPDLRGERSGWTLPKFDDTGWPLLQAKSSWQAQGFADFTGVAWYRKRLSIPKDWQDSRILLQTTGVYNEYDLYINGKFLKHFGSAEQSVAWDPTEPDLTSYLRFGELNEIVLKVKSEGSQGGIYRRIQVRRVPPFEKYKKFLPVPTLDSHPELVDLYWQSWRMAFKNVSFGNSENKFVEAYMEEGYNEQIYQWDSIFMSMYGRYGGKLIPAMATLDNFYARQGPDGHIARIYSKTDGGEIVSPVKDEFTLTNPPLFAWSEWDYFRMSGDDSRLARVLPILERYDQWLELNQASTLVPGMYWQTGFDSGMDNMPRPNMRLAGWVDASLQQVLAAKYLAQISRHLKDDVRSQSWEQKRQLRSLAIQKLAWNETDGFFYDVDRDLKQTGVKHLGALWSLLSGVATAQQAKRLHGHLLNPLEFFRPHLFPALSASDPGYTLEATYWQGGVWAPTNYMTIRGLKEYGYDDLAHTAAMNHITNMAKVYSSKIDESHVDPNEANADYRTIWECYNPEKIAPCTRADRVHYGRQDFAGWTALGPIALLIQEGIGLEIIGSENRVEWTLRDKMRTGLAHMELQKGNYFSVLAEPGERTRKIITRAQKAFVLLVKVGGQQRTFQVPAGNAVFEIRLNP